MRDYTKWDDYPASLQHFAELTVRAYKIAMTPPTLPVVIVADGALQENPIEEGEKLRIPKLPAVAAPQGDSGAVAETARMLVNAEHPVLIADRYARTQEGNDRLVELAELLQCPSSTPARASTCRRAIRSIRAAARAGMFGRPTSSSASK